MISTMALVVGIVVVVSPDLDVNSSEFWALIGCLMLTLVLFIFIMFFLKLETKIDEQGIHYGFWPFQLNLKLISWLDINECYVRSYSPIAEYGGWGYRSIGFGKNGTAYNVKGSKGIQIVMKNDKRILIGTQKDTEAERIINSFFIKKKSL